MNLFSNVPMPVMVTATVSPGFSQEYLLSFLPSTTPLGVPVKIISPFCRVMYWDTNSIIASGLNSICCNLACYRTSPFTVVVIVALSKSKSSGDTITGPIGAKLSSDLPRIH